MKAVYMYHAIGSDSDITGADPHYAVSREDFIRHLDVIAPSRTLVGTFESQTLDSHILTFDDGHLSNYSIALPLILEKNFIAEFYINTSVIGKSMFIDWQQAREMVEAGMSLQSHAHTHRYMSDLADSEIRDELDRSKKMIEDKLGREVSVFAPPGGRFDARVDSIAMDLGYKTLAVSKPGHMKNATQKLVPRYAVLQSTSVSQIENLRNSYSSAALKQVAKYHIMGVGKRILGNKVYDVLRERLLGQN